MSWNLGIVKAVASVFSVVSATASAAERLAKSADNLAQLSENYTGNMVEEQKLINKQRIKDMSAKAEKKYAEEKKGWNV